LTRATFHQECDEQREQVGISPANFCSFDSEKIPKFRKFPCFRKPVHPLQFGELTEMRQVNCKIPFGIRRALLKAEQPALKGLKK